MKRSFVVRRDNPRRATVCEAAIQHMRERYGHGDDFDIEIRDPKRSLDANACMWATLADIASQVEWPHTVNGAWQIGLMDSESWKAVLTAAHQAETRMAQGVGGGAVMLGARTSKFTKRQMGDFLEFCNAFGSERGVRWSEKALEDLARWAPPDRGAA